MHLREFAYPVEQALGQGAIPRPDCHVGDRIVGACEILGLCQPPIEDIELALNLQNDRWRTLSSSARRRRSRARCPSARTAKTSIQRESLTLMQQFGRDRVESGHRVDIVDPSKMMLWMAPTLRHRCAKGWLR